MKRFLALLVAVVFAAGAAGLAVAQTTTAPTPAPAPMKEKAAEMKGKAAEMKAEKKFKNVMGVVKSAAADSVVVSGKEKVQGAKEMKDAEWTFAVDSKTAIKKAGKSITAGDLKAGDQVHVRYTDQDGKATAVGIQVTPGMAKKEAANPCAAKK